MSEKEGKDQELLKKYNKLKRRYKSLRHEYTVVLGARTVKGLMDERRFLKDKLVKVF